VCYNVVCLEVRVAYLKRAFRNMTLKTPRSYGYLAVDSVRDTLLKTDYDRFPESELVKIRRGLMTAVMSNEIEGLIRCPEQVALDEMLIDMRIRAGAVRRYATQLWLDLAMQPGSDMRRREEYLKQFQTEIQQTPSFTYE